MFDSLDRLGNEIDGVVDVALASGNRKLQADVLQFVIDVQKEISLAYSDVFEVLSEIAFLKPSELTDDKVMELKARLVNTYSRERFKNALKICERLHVLAERFKADIEPHLSEAGGVPHASQLFWMLHKHEGAFMYVIRNAVEQITDILDQYQSGTNIDAARARARQAQLELKTALEHVTAIQTRFVGALPNGSARILDLGGVADDVLRKSPFFSGGFYLATIIILLTALTIVAGNVKPWAFPLVVVASLSGLTLIGALQLRNDNRLSEKNFLTLVDLALRRVLLPLAKKR